MWLAAGLGLALASPPPPVVGGEAAAPDDWPDAVALFDGQRFVCSGVLVAPDLVLTAGHCGQSLSVALIDTVDITDPVERIDVVGVVAVDNWWEGADAALVQLASSARAPYRQIARGCVLDGWLRLGAPVSVVGFGATNSSGSRQEGLLVAAETEIVDVDCLDTGLGCAESIAPGGEVIAGGQGVDSCVGDSGGPLYLHTDGGAFLLGLTSRAVADAAVACGDGGIYTRVDAILPWVESVSGRTLDEPDCDRLAGLNHAPVLAAEAVRVAPGGVGETRVSVSDQDADDAHTLVLLDRPEHGDAWLDGSVLRWRAPVDWLGATTARVRATDQAGAVADLRVRLISGWGEGDARGCGCGVTGAPRIGLAILAVVALCGGRRRRVG